LARLDWIPSPSPEVNKPHQDGEELHLQVSRQELSELTCQWCIWCCHAHWGLSGLCRAAGETQPV